MKTFANKHCTIWLVGIALYTMPFGTTASTKNASEAVSIDSVYDNVDELPYLKNHRKSTTENLQRRLVYPEMLKVKGIEGNVVVTFTVSKNGSVKNATTNHDAPTEMCEEALRTVMASGPWMPAKVKGEEVDSKMSVVLKFVLTDEERKVAEMLKPIDFDNKPPLFVLDGKVVDGIVKIEHYNLRSLRVIKGEKALAMYGEKGRNGVVEVTSKRGTPPVR